MQFIEHTEPQEPALILSLAQAKNQHDSFYLLSANISSNLFQIATMNIPALLCTENRTFTFSNFQLNRFSSASHTEYAHGFK